MSYAVRFSAAAAQDLEAIVEFIARDNEKRALSFANEVQDRLQRKLAVFPRSGPAFGKYRYTVVDNYVAVYRVNDTALTVDVVLVAEGHRDWQRLLRDL